MNISILCTDFQHPVMPSLRQWQSEMRKKGHAVSIWSDKKDLVGGDILFLVSCSQKLGDAERAKFSAALVLHASDLPEGRGWSPHVWAILSGTQHITVCLLEAADPIDSGPVWFRTRFRLEGHELLPEINRLLFTCELALMTRAIEDFALVEPTLQVGEPGPLMKRRTPADSRLDPDKSIAEQFELLRVVDNQRYPAFFDHRGRRYRITIEKVDHDQ